LLGSIVSNLEALKSLAGACKACMDCDLAQSRKTVVFGSGNPDAKILVIGEGPGENEDQTGVPFVGLSGQLLTNLFNQVGLSRETDLFITNTVRCRPPHNRDPLPLEVDACSKWLKAQQEILDPRIVVLVGRIAAGHYLGRDVKITKERGQWLQTQPHVMAILHPSYLLRNPGSESIPIRDTLKDLSTIREKYQDLKKAGTLMSSHKPQESFWNDLQDL